LTGKKGKKKVEKKTPLRQAHWKKPRTKNLNR